MAPPRLLGGSGARRERGGGEEDARGAVRNLVRDIKSELAMQREREHVPGGKGNEGADDGDDARAKKMLEELVEKHFRRGVYVGTFFSSLLFLLLRARSRDNKQQQTLVFFKNTHALKNLLSLSLLFLFFFFFFFRRNVRVGDDDIILSHRRRVFDARSASSVARCDAKTTKLVQTRRKVFVGGGGDGVFTRVSLDVRGVVFFGYEKGCFGVGVQIDAVHRGR